MHVYLAGPMCSSSELSFNALLESVLRAAGHEVYLPQRDAPPAEATEAERFAANLEALERADAVVAVLDGPQVDDGTAWEIGYAWARGTPIVGLKTDRREPFGPTEPVNLMILCAISCLARDTSDVLHALTRYASTLQ